MIAASRIQWNNVVNVPPVESVVAPVHAIKEKGFDMLFELTDRASEKFNGLPVALPIQHCPSSCPVGIMESIPKRLFFAKACPESPHVNICGLGVSRFPKTFEFRHSIGIACSPLGVVLPLLQKSGFPVLFPVGLPVSLPRLKLLFITFRHEARLHASQKKQGQGRATIRKRSWRSHGSLNQTQFKVIFDDLRVGCLIQTLPKESGMSDSELIVNERRKPTK